MAGFNTAILAPFEHGVKSISLTGVINHTDDYGRTSCAFSEMEHYRLRTLGLVKAAEKMAIAIDAVDNEFARLKTYIRTGGRKSPAPIESSNGIDSITSPEVAVQRMSQMIAGKTDRIRTKSRLEQTLKMVIGKYTNLIFQEMFSRLREALPQELVDLVWQHVVDESLTMEIKGEIYVVPLRRGHARLTEVGGDLTKSWYFDTDIVGHETANELRKFFWAKSTFRFEDRYTLKLFLTTLLPWYDYPPQDILQHIVVRASNLRIGIPESRGILVRYLTLMGNLKYSKAAITLDIGSADPDSRSEFEQKLPRHYEVHENIPTFTAVEDQQAQNAAHRSKIARASLEDPAFVMLVRDLEPLFSYLLRRGHTSYIIDEKKCWRWVKYSGRIEGEIDARCVRCWRVHGQLDIHD